MGYRMLLDSRLLQIWENLAFNKLLKAFPVAVSPTRLMLGLMALASIALIGWVMDQGTRSVVVKLNPQPSAKEAAIYVSDLERTVLEYGNRIKPILDKARQAKPGGKPATEVRLGVFTSLWRFGSAQFNEATMSLFSPDPSNLLDRFSTILAHVAMSSKGLFWAFRYHPLYSVVFFLLSGLILSFFAGAICRSAALEYGRGEKPGLLEVLGFSAQKFGSLISAPSLVVAIMFGAGVFVVLLGLLANIPWGIGPILLGLGLGPALIFGLFTVLLLIGTTAGANLMFPVIAFEGSDGYDAVSRSLRYVFSHPFWVLFYDLAAVIYGILCYLIVRLFAFLVLLTTYGLLRLGLYTAAGAERFDRLWSCPSYFFLIGPDGAPQGSAETVAYVLIRLTLLFVVGLVVAFVISFVCSANTIIYSLLRRHIDRVSTVKVHVKLDEVLHPHNRLDAESSDPDAKETLSRTQP
jgi:hypothetical protein